MAFNFMGMKEEESQADFDYVVSLVEGSRLLAEQATDENASFDLQPGRKMSVDRMRMQTEQDVQSSDPAVSQRAEKKLERIDLQLERLEALERNQGADGSVSRVVFGETESVAVDKERSLIRRMFGGSSLLTVVHENAHANFKQLLDRGAVTVEETGNFFMELDKSLAGRTDRQGNELRFIPEGVTAPSFEQVDEAMAEFAEVMLLRTKGGKKSAMRSLLGKNLSAMVKARVPGAGKFSSFIRAMREMFGRTLSRKVAIDKAIRDGQINESQIEEYRAMLQGTTLQEEYDTDVKAKWQQYDDSQVGVDADNPFSIGFDSFSKNPLDYTFEIDDSPAERIAEVAERHGLTILKHPSDESARITDFERDSGIKVAFYRREGRQVASSNINDLTAAFVAPTLPSVLFVNSAAPSPMDSLLSHELIHSAQRDSQSGYADLESRLLALLSPVEKADIEIWLKAKAYDADQIPREIVPYLVGSSISNHQEMGIDTLENADEIREVARQFYADTNQLNPSGLAKVSDEDLIGNAYSIGDSPMRDSLISHEQDASYLAAVESGQPCA